VIVAKGHHITALRASFEGVRAKVTRSKTRGGRAVYFVRVDLRGLTKGLYVARIRYRLNGHRDTKVHYYRACTGNPKGGLGEGPNRFPATVI
jgi:hypothetical protein